MNPEEVLALAERALSEGRDPGGVDEKIKNLTQGQFSSVEDLRDGVKNAAAYARINEGGGSAVGDVAHKLAEGFLPSVSDELAGVGAYLVPGGKGYTEARDAERQRLADLSQLAPKTSFALNMLGGAAVPAFGAEALGSKFAAATGRKALGGVLGAATAGAGMGALAGAGAGETPMGRLLGGVLGAGVGGAAGGVFAGLGAGVQTLAKKFINSKAEGLTEGAAYKLRSLVKDGLKHSGMSPEEIEAKMLRLDKLAEGGPKATPADVSQVLRERVLPGAINEAPAVSREGSAVSAVRAGRTVPKPHHLYDDFAKWPVEEGDFPGIEEVLDIPEVKAAVRNAAKGRRLPTDKPPPATIPNPDFNTERFGESFLLKNGVPRELPNPDLKDAPPPITVEDLQDALVTLRGMSRRKAGYNTSGDKVGTEVLPGEARRAGEAYNALRGAMGEDIPGFDEAQKAFRKASKKQRAFDKTKKAAVKGSAVKSGGVDAATMAGDLAAHGTYAHGISRILARILFGRGASHPDVQAANEALANMLVSPTTAGELRKALSPRFRSEAGFVGGLLSSPTGSAVNSVLGKRGR